MNNLGLFGKMAIPVIALIALVSMILAIFIPQQLNRTVIDGVIQNSQSTVDQFKILRKYYTQNIIKKVVVSQDLRPSINHKNDPKKVPLPATMIHGLSGLMKDKGTVINFIVPFHSPIEKIDGWTALNNPHGIV